MDTSADSAATPDEAERGGGSRRRGSGRGAEAAEDPEQYARETVYRLLTSRARSRAELREALARKEVDAEVIDSVLGKFAAAGLIDDAAFAEEWVASRRRSRGLGRRALGYELRKKGIDEEIIASVLATADNEDEEERARELVRRKLAASRGGDAAAVTRRLVGMLARRGYAEGLAFRVVREELESSGADGSELDEEIP
ncbi:hypothetical protein GCM10027174_22660 [Salinifilum aidingensis]